MKILVEAKGDVKYINSEDFNKLRDVLNDIREKYDIDLEIRNFKVIYPPSFTNLFKEVKPNVFYLGEKDGTHSLFWDENRKSVIIGITDFCTKTPVI